MVIHYGSQRAAFYLDRDSSFFNAAQLDACAIIKHSERIFARDWWAQQLLKFNNSIPGCSWILHRAEILLTFLPILLVDHIRAILWPEKMIQETAILFDNLIYYAPAHIKNSWLGNLGDSIVGRVLVFHGANPGSFLNTLNNTRSTVRSDPGVQSLD